MSRVTHKEQKRKRNAHQTGTGKLVYLFSGNSLHEFQKRPIGNRDRPNKGAAGRESNCADWN